MGIAGFLRRRYKLINLIGQCVTVTVNYPIRSTEWHTGTLFNRLIGGRGSTFIKHISFHNILEVYKAYLQPFQVINNIVKWSGVDKLWLGIDLSFVQNVGVGNGDHE